MPARGRRGRQRLVLHVGTLKTGSTTLQQTLGALAPELRRRGVHVPLAARLHPRRGQHGNLRRALTGRGFQPECGGWPELATELRRSDAEQFVVSDEWFASEPPGALPRRFAELARGCRLDVDVVGYVRPQWRYLESRYTEMVKTNDEHKPFDLFCAVTLAKRPAAHPWLSYRRAFAPWRAAFGDRVTLVPLQPGRPAAGPVGHFLDVLGAGDLADRAAAPANTRPGAKETEVRRLASAARARRAGTQRSPLPRLAELLADDAPFAGFDVAQARAVMALFEADNAAFARECGIASGMLFRRPLAGAPARRHVVCWADLDPAQRRAVRGYVLRETGVDPAPVAATPARPSTKGRIGSLRWRTAWALDAGFRRCVRAGLAARARGIGRRR